MHQKPLSKKKANDPRRHDPWRHFLLFGLLVLLCAALYLLLHRFGWV